MSATLSITRDEVIKAAMQVCQALAKGQSPDATDLADFSVFLNAMLKLWNTQGYKAWLWQTLIIPCVANKVSYTIGEAAADFTAPKPLRVLQAYTTDANGNKTPLQFMERANWESLTPKNAPGVCNSFYYDPMVDGPGGLATHKGTFYPWLVPTDTSQTFNLVVMRPIEDILTGAGTFDIPSEAYLALIWGLAEQIGSLCGTSDGQLRRIEGKAAEYRDTALNFWEEDGSVFFQPSAQIGQS